MKHIFLALCGIGCENITSNELKKNGSPKATFETDEHRSYFLINIPCHPDLVGQNPLEVNDRINDRIKLLKNKERLLKIIKLLSQQNMLSVPELSSIIGVSQPTIWRDIRTLTELNLLQREGSKRNGHWRIITSV